MGNQDDGEAEAYSYPMALLEEKITHTNISIFTDTSYNLHLDNDYKTSIKYFSCSKSIAYLHKIHGIHS